MGFITDIEDVLKEAVGGESLHTIIEDSVNGIIQSKLGTLPVALTTELAKLGVPATTIATIQSAWDASLLTIADDIIVDLKL